MSSEITSAKRSAASYLNFAGKALDELTQITNRLQGDNINYADVLLAETIAGSVNDYIDKIRNAVDCIHYVSGLDPDDESSFKEKYFLLLIQFQNKCQGPLICCSCSSKDRIC
jgi:hypothetical protein